MKLALISAAAAFSIYTFVPLSHAQSTAEEAQQQLELIKETLRNAGLDGEAQGQVEGILGGIMDQGLQQQAAEDAKLQAAFDKRVAGLGNAVISVNDKEYEFQVTQCETVLLEGGEFSLEAQQGPNSRDGALGIRGESSSKRVALWLTTRDGMWETHIYGDVPFDGQTFEWHGEVDGDWKGKLKDGEKAYLSLRLQCHE